MEIIIVCHYFYPELGAPAARILETAKLWVSAGHQVTVVTCFPNHPVGVIPPQYRGKLFQEEEVAGIRVLRNFVYATPNEGFFRKILGHLSFMFSSVLCSLPRLGRPDVIIVSSPTYFSVFSAYLMSRLKGVPFVFEVRDLWPEAIVKLGVLKNKAIIRLLDFFVMYFYQKAGRVVVVTRAFRETLRRKGVEPGKIEVITNGVDHIYFTPPAEEEVARLRVKYNLEDKFVVLYVGTHGISQALDKVVQAAQLLEERPVHVLFVGEGAEKKKLQAQAAALGLSNIQFLPGQPREQMPLIYALADVCLVTHKQLDLFREFIPSKIFEIMACSKPIIAGLAGEAAELLQEAGSALVVEPENSREMAAAITRLAEDEDLRNKLGRQGREYVRRHYTRRGLAERYGQILEQLVGREKR